MANLWRQFRQLLPIERTIIVTVEGHNGDGTSTVTTDAGSTLMVQGESIAVGEQAFLRGGRIEVKAPNLPSYEETVYMRKGGDRTV